MRRLYSLAEICKLVETLGGKVKTLHEYLFLSLMGKCELDKIDCFVVRKSLRCPKQRSLIKLLDDFIGAADELVYIGVLGIKQAPQELPLMVLKFLWGGE